MNEFLFSVPSGEPVSIELFHYAIIGQTQFSGKSTLIKRLASAAVDQGFKVLIFDTKETEADYAGFGQEVPVCLRESTDSFVLIGLLESMFRRRLTPYYATLSRITEAAKGYDDIIDRAKELEQRTRSAWLKDACRVLYDLLERLKSETSKVETVPHLKLYPGINRMVINDFSLEAQQLIVKNSFEDLLRVYKHNTIGVLDEAFKFIPQGYSSAATRSIMNVMTQGAKTGLFGWISTQFLAATDKGPLKACAFKFLGTQDHITEVKHTLDLIPEIRGKFSPDDIMKLKLGHWILVRKRPPDVRIVYSLPLGVPSWAGHNVATSVVMPEEIRDKYLTVKVMEDEDLYKEKYEEERRKREELEREFARQVERVSDLKAEEKIKSEVEKFRVAKEGLEKDYGDLKLTLETKLAEAEDTIKEARAHVHALEDEVQQLKKDAEWGRKFRELFQEIIPTPMATSMPTADIPSEVAVVTEQPSLTVEVRRKPLTLSTDNAQGRAALLYAEGFFDEEEQTISAIQKEMIRRGWPKDPRLSGFLDEMCSWGFLRKRRTDRWLYKAAMKSTDARSKGLLKEVEADA